MHLFVGREADLRSIQEYIHGDDSSLLGVVGEPGSGKSALVTRAADRARQANPGAAIVVRFIGATQASADIRTVLHGLCEELAADTPPIEYADLVLELPARLELGASRGLVIVFLDGLDQLSGAHGARSLGWLPGSLPPNVRIVVSTSRGESEAALRSKTPEPRLVELGPLSREEGEVLLAARLEDVGRTLQPRQRELVLDRFASSGGLPLYLELAIEEARRWRSETRNDSVELGASIPGLIRGALERLAADHGEYPVWCAVGCIAAARAGLSEDELLDVLDDRLPHIAWSRLRSDLEAYLSTHVAEGAQLLAFSHGQFRNVVGGLLAREEELECHRRLARYFGDPERQPLERDGVPNLRRLSELPYQQASGELWEDALETLTDVRFLELKVANLGPYALEDDYARVLERMPQDEARAVVERFAGAIRREAKVLSAHPGLLWQQLFNRLQLDALAPELERRTAPGAAPWLRLRTPLQEESGPAVHTLHGHLGRVSGCALSRNGSVVVSAGADLTVRVWDPSTGAEKARLAGHADWATDCAISSDGFRLVTASRDGTVGVWDAETGERRLTLAHDGYVSSCDVSGDGSLVVSASDDGTLTLWDAERGVQLSALEGHRAAVTDCAMDLEGRLLVSTSEDGMLYIWDARSGQLGRALEAHNGPALACAISDDGSLVVSAGRDATLKVWDVASGEASASLVGHDAAVTGCAISSEGSVVASSSADGTVRLWEAATGAARLSLEGHGAGVNDCAIGGDGSFVVSASDDGTVRLWDTGAGPERRVRLGHTGEILDCAASSDGSFVVSAGADGTLRLWDAAGRRVLETLAGHTREVCGCATSADGSLVVSASRDGTLKVWDRKSGVERLTLSGHQGAVNGCAVSPDGAFVVSASSDETLALWDPGSGRELTKLRGHAAPVTDCAVGPDGALLVSGDAAGSLRLWDASTGQALATLAAHDQPVTDCVVGPDGAFVASASRDGSIALWDSATGERHAAFAGGGAPIFGCGITPDAACVVGASVADGVTVWDVGSGAQLASAPLPGGATCVALNPGLPRVVAGSPLGVFHVLDLMGVDYGPIVVTADDRGVRCPVCLGRIDVESRLLGHVLECPRPGCEGRMRTNTFRLSQDRGVGGHDPG